jgi:ketosteroid isomerase-like protein
VTASANVDLVRSIFAAWERGDYGSLEWAAPSAQFVRVDGPNPGVWGLSQLTDSWRDILGAWREFRMTAEEYRELDDERVLVLTQYGGRGRTSGLQLEQLGAKGAQVVYLDRGKVTKVVLYWERNRALADLGLASEDDSQR